MQLNEVSRQLNLSKRAIKFYEEKGLLQVEKSPNGYRNYTDENVRTLKEISLYRKLGISLADIRSLLSGKAPGKLEQIYEEKKRTLALEAKELEALGRFLENNDVDTACAAVDYETIAQAMQEMIPGFYGAYFMNHFLPYLQIKIHTEEQQKAYETIICFWDNTKIRIPLFLRISGFITLRLLPRQSMEQLVRRTDARLQSMLHPTEEEYQKLLEQTRKGVKFKNSLFVRIHPAFIAQRRFMKRLQDCGYNDIFIPAMTRLSPKYREYHEALTAVNQRICKDLGLYYDSKFRMVMHPSSPPHDRS